jgi:hypothetical protein
MPGRGALPAAGSSEAPSPVLPPTRPPPSPRPRTRGESTLERDPPAFPAGWLRGVSHAGDLQPRRVPQSDRAALVAELNAAVLERSAGMAPIGAEALTFTSITRGGPHSGRRSPHWGAAAVPDRVCERNGGKPTQLGGVERKSYPRLDSPPLRGLATSHLHQLSTRGHERARSPDPRRARGAVRSRRGSWTWTRSRRARTSSARSSA